MVEYILGKLKWGLSKVIPITGQDLGSFTGGKIFIESAEIVLAANISLL